MVGERQSLLDFGIFDSASIGWTYETERDGVASMGKFGHSNITKA